MGVKIVLLKIGFITNLVISILQVVVVLILSPEGAKVFNSKKIREMKNKAVHLGKNCLLWEKTD